MEKGSSGVLQIPTAISGQINRIAESFKLPISFKILQIFNRSLLSQFGNEFVENIMNLRSDDDDVTILSIQIYSQHILNF